MRSEISLLISYGYVRNLQNYLYDSCSFLRQFIAPVNAVRNTITQGLFFCVLASIKSQKVFLGNYNIRTIRIYAVGKFGGGNTRMQFR
jgi:hypothetical protein